MDFEPLSKQVIGCALEVHKALGPGLLESTYQQCLARELDLTGLEFKLEQPIAVHYKGVTLDCGYRVDLLVEQHLIVELKSVDKLNAIHEAQILTYLRLARLRTGLLINFNVPLLRQGIRRFII